MHTILVTGGAGFIGSHLCETLLENGKKVVNLDSFNDFYDPEIKRGNIRGMFQFIRSHGLNPGLFVPAEGNILDLQFLDDVFSSSRVDMVIHLAAYAGVRPSIQNPLLYTNVNIQGTANLLEMCRKYTVRKFIFASSSSVYGNNRRVPFRETDHVDFPVSPYAATKKAGELLCHTWHHLHGIDAACLRFFTVYGPRQRPDLAICKFARLMKEGREIPFYGDGSTERDYTYISDIVDGIMKAVLWIDKGSGKYEIFNLGESRTIRLDRMVKTLEEALGIKAVIKKMPVQPGDVERTFADIGKAREVLGYRPAVGFEEGIGKFADWFIKNT